VRLGEIVESVVILAEIIVGIADVVIIARDQRAVFEDDVVFERQVINVDLFLYAFDLKEGLSSFSASDTASSEYWRLCWKSTYCVSVESSIRTCMRDESGRSFFKAFSKLSTLCCACVEIEIKAKTASRVQKIFFFTRSTKN